MANLADDVKAVLAAPWWVEKNEALRKVVLHYKQMSEVVQDVLNGKTTFAAEVRPLVEENLRIKMPLINSACNVSWFLAMAVAKQRRLMGIIPLEVERSIDGHILTEVSLVSRMALPKRELLFFTLAPLLISSVFMPWYFSLIGACSFNAGDFGKCAVSCSILSLVAGFVGFFFAFHPIFEKVAKRKDFARSVMSDARLLDDIVRERVP